MVMMMGAKLDQQCIGRFRTMGEVWIQLLKEKNATKPLRKQSTGTLLRFLFIPAFLCMTDLKSTLLFGGFFKQEPGTALGAFFSYRLVPYGKVAVGKVAAAVEYFATL